MTIPRRLGGILALALWTIFASGCPKSSGPRGLPGGKGEAAEPTYKVQLQIGHSEQVNDIAYSPDGQLLASVSNDNTIKLWNTERGKLVNTLLGHSGSISAVAFSPDGKILATFGYDKTIRLWNPGSGENLRTFTPGQRVTHLAFHPSGRMLATSLFETPTIVVWDLEQGRPVHELKGHTDDIKDLVFTPDGALLASCGEDSSIKLWNPSTGALVHALDGEGKWIVDLAITPDGKFLAAAALDKTLRLWNPTTGKRVAAIEMPAAVKRVAASPDSSRIAVAGSDNAIQLVDLGQGKITHTLTGHRAPNTSMAFSADSGRILTTDFGAMAFLWDVKSGKRLKGLPGHGATISKGAFHPGGTQVATGSWDRTVTLWDPENGGVLYELGQGIALERVFHLAMSSDGSFLAASRWGGRVGLWKLDEGRYVHRLLAGKDSASRIEVTGDAKFLATYGDRPSIELWELTPLLADAAADKQEGKKSPAAKKPRLLYAEKNKKKRTNLLRAAFSPDGKILAAASFSPEVALWNVDKGALVGKLTGHTGPVGWVVFSADGKHVISASADRSVKVWDVSKRSLITDIKDHQGPVGWVGISADSSRIAAMAGTGSVHLWTRNGEEVATHDGGKVTMLALSPDGRYLGWGDMDGAATVVDSKSGEILRRIEGHADRVYVIAFSRDGSQLFTASRDTTIKHWETATGELRRTFTGHSSEIRSLLVSPDGRRLLSAGLDGTIRVWNIATGASTALMATDTDWLAVTDDGYFDGSAAAKDMISVTRDGELLSEKELLSKRKRSGIIVKRLGGKPKPAAAAAKK